MITIPPQYQLGQKYHDKIIVRTWLHESGKHPERISMVLAKDVYFDEQRGRPYFSCLVCVSVDMNTGIEYSHMFMDKQDFDVPKNHELWKEVSND